MRIITIALVTIFLGAIGYALISDQGFIVSQEEAVEGNLLTNVPEFTDQGEAPEIQGIASWINSEPLTLKELRGKVVLVDFWTYSCINCIRTIPHLNRLYQKYKDDGFVLIGVHTPEFEFEQDRDNVLENIKKEGVTYPVALDNDYATWNAYENQFWPASYLIDAAGNIQFTHFGEGRYAETESAVQQLLLDAGLLPLAKLNPAAEVPPDVLFENIGTPEIYLGALRIANAGNNYEKVLVNEPYLFEEVAEQKFNLFYFTGLWRVTREFSEFLGEEGQLLLQYKANKANIVLSTSNKEVLLKVQLANKYLTEENKGDDVFIENGVSFMKVKEARLYNFTNTQDDYGIHSLEVILTSPGLRAFAFTFG